MDLRQKAKNLFGDEFLKELDRVAKRLGFAPIWLLYLMESESGMNPKAIGYNKDGTMDFGLIQFNDTYTLPQYGITGYGLINLSPIQQLQYIERYYKYIAGKVERVGKMYLWNLSPKWFVESPNSADSLAFIQKVEKKYTEITGKSPFKNPIYGVFSNKYFWITAIVIITALIVFKPFKKR